MITFWGDGIQIGIGALLTVELQKCSQNLPECLMSVELLPSLMVRFLRLSFSSLGRGVMSGREIEIGDGRKARSELSHVLLFFKDTFRSLQLPQPNIGKECDQQYWGITAVL